MAKFDVETYYAEQDERMNLPDEVADKYIKRVSSLLQRYVHTAPKVSILIRQITVKKHP